MRADMMRCELAIPLECLGRYLGRGPRFPLIEKLRQRGLCWGNVIAAIGGGFEPHQFGLRFAFRALERMVFGEALAGAGVGLEVEFQFPRSLAASADMAGHFASSSSSKTPMRLVSASRSSGLADR